MRRGFRALLTGMVLAVLLAGAANAQETTATVVGLITDESGAALPGVTVVATHLPTGRRYTFVSTNTGAYRATLLPSGAYTIEFSLAGFQTLTLTKITLSVNDRQEINGTLKLGGISETIQVSAESALVQPSSAIQSLVDARQVQELPLNNRNFAQLATLAPGVSSDLPDEVGVGLTSNVSLSVNGARRNALNWLVDGVSNVDVGSNITLLSTPTLESIEEFKIITSSYAAEWPRSGGGIVNVVTKSGTSGFKGSGYYFLRDDSLNANTYFRKLSSDAAVRDNAPPLDYKNFGYTLGGPAKVVKRLFFFWSQEWRRINRAPTSLTANVPDPAWLTDPTNANYVAPADRDANAVRLLAAYPAPNSGTNQYLVSSPNINNTRQEVVRLDYDVSDHWRLTGRYTHDLSETRELGGLFQGFAIPNVATTDTAVPGHILSVALKSIFGFSTLNEFSYQKSGNKISTTNPAGTKGRRADYGLNIPEVFTENASGRIPNIAIAGLSSFGSAQIIGIEYLNHTVTDNFSIQKGNHALKSGVLMTFEQKNENAANTTQGSFSFVAGGGFTAFQNFLRGNSDGACTACSYTEAERDVTNNLRFSRYEMYAQDTWRALPNMTVDLGVRYSLYPPITDTNNLLVTFDPSLYRAASAPPYANAAGTLVDYSVGDPLVGLIIAGKNSPFGDAIYAFKKNSIQPRIGFTLDPFSTGSTILRGAYGIYYDQPLVGVFEQNSFTSPPFVNNVSLSGGVRLSNPGAGVSSTTSGVRTIQATATDFENPRMMQWNIGVTRTLFADGVIEVGYVGSRGDNLIRPTNVNFPQPADVVALQNTVAGAVNPARPFRSYGTITMRETTAISRYHGLLTAFRWNAGDRGTVNVNYTLSRNRTDASNDRDTVDIPQNPANLAAEYADARTDRRHILSASYVYVLPFFQSSSNQLLKATLGGWQVAGITYANSGQPMTRIAVDTNNFRRGNFADQVADPGAGQQSGLFWFDPLAYTPPADGTFGNSGRSPFRQPGFHKWDFTLSKNFQPSRVRVQVRADLLNAFNQVNWASDPVVTGLDNTCTTSVTTCQVSTDRFGQLIAARAAREIQLGLKLYW